MPGNTAAILSLGLLIAACGIEHAAAQETRIPGRRLPPATGQQGVKETEPSLLAVLAPVPDAEGYLVPGEPKDVFPGLVRIIRSDRTPLGETEWLNGQGIPYKPPQRDPVIARDYNPSETEAEVIVRLDSVTTATRGAVPFRIEQGQAFVRGLAPGPYCLILPGDRPLATATHVSGPVTLIRSESWEPILYQYYVSILSAFDEPAFRAALSSGPFAQVNPLIKRMRTVAVLTPVDMFLFYRGYYEALALARWIETSPDGRLLDFINRLRTTDEWIDQLVAEALRQQDLTGQMNSPAESAPPPPSQASSPEAASPPPWTGGVADGAFRPGLSQYKSFYYIGLAAFFASEAQDLALLRSAGGFTYPEESRLYSEQYRELARLSAQWAREASPANPLLPVLEGHLEFTPE